MAQSAQLKFKDQAMSRIPSLIVFILAVLGGGILIGYATLPGPWYAALNKPSFTPPNWLFGPVWSILYVMIAVAGWRCWHRDPRGLAMKLWFVQMVLNFMWSPIFFGLHQPAAAFVVIIATTCTIIAFIVIAAKKDRLSAALLLPYALWTSFATVLNGAIVTLN